MNLKRSKARRDPSNVRVLRELAREWSVNPMHEEGLVLADALEEKDFGDLAREIRNHRRYGRMILMPVELLARGELARATKPERYMREHSLLHAEKVFERNRKRLVKQVFDALDELEKKSKIGWYVDLLGWRSIEEYISRNPGRPPLAYPVDVQREPGDRIYGPNHGHGYVLAGRLKNVFRSGVTLTRENYFKLPPKGVALAPGTRHFLRGVRE